MVGVVGVVGVVVVMVVVVVVVGDCVVVSVVLLVGLVVAPEVVLAQSLAASSETVDAPCPRFWIRVVSTLRGNPAIWLENRCAADAAAPQSPEETADEIESSSALSRLASPDESRPLVPPHATTKAAAKPRLPARSTRAPDPIRRLTLEAVGFS
jgi:hypothetical protein